MAREFEYDTTGLTSYLFVMSILGMYLIPTTFSYFGEYFAKPQPENEDLSFAFLDNQSPDKKWKIHKEKQIKKFKFKKRHFFFLVCWVCFLYMALTFNSIEYTYEEYDPYAILQIDPGSSEKEIKKQYRTLSKILHPDKNTDNPDAEAKFIQLAKAYQTLTDPLVKKNWEEFGHPDGKQAITFGIALPAWIVNENYRYLVLGVYCLVFMVIMPVCVGVWWSHSSKYAGNQVLMATSALYYHFVAPNMSYKKIVELLGASAEFKDEIQLKSSDNEAIPELALLIPEKFEKTKFTHPYCIKAKTILNAYLFRIPEIPDSVVIDMKQMVVKSMRLLQAMIAMANYKRNCLNSAIHCMELSQMLVQASWDSRTPLLQLPYIDSSMLKHFVTSKLNIRNIYSLIQMDEPTRRSLLRQLDDLQYERLLRVLNTYPHVTMKYECKVLDENLVTAGSVVTVKVTLHRVAGMEAVKKALSETPQSLEAAEELKKSKEESSADVRFKKIRKGKGTILKCVNVSKKNKEESPGTDSTCSTESVSVEEIPEVNSEPSEENHVEEVYDDDAEWEKLQSDIKKEKILEDIKTASHKVYSPFYPENKTEGWWLFLGDAKMNLVLTPILRIEDLETVKQHDLQFQAPFELGQYLFILFLVSDSYFGADQKMTVKFHVHEAAPIEELPPLDSDPEESADSDEEIDFDVDAEQIEKEDICLED